MDDIVTLSGVQCGDDGNDGQPPCEWLRLSTSEQSLRLLVEPIDHGVNIWPTTWDHVQAWRDIVLRQLLAHVIPRITYVQAVTSRSQDWAEARLEEATKRLLTYYMTRRMSSADASHLSLPPPNLLRDDPLSGSVGGC